MEIKFIEKGAFTLHLMPHIEGVTYIPVYMIKDGKEYFIRNKEATNEKDELIERIKVDLIKNNGIYVKEYGVYDNPADLIEYIQRRDYTFEKGSTRGANANELFEDYRQSGKYGEGFIDFSGNVCEVSCAFSYRIYDNELYKSLREKVERDKKDSF